MGIDPTSALEGYGDLTTVQIEQYDNYFEIFKLLSIVLTAIALASLLQPLHVRLESNPAHRQNSAQAGELTSALVYCPTPVSHSLTWLSRSLLRSCPPPLQLRPTVRIPCSKGRCATYSRSTSLTITSRWLRSTSTPATPANDRRNALHSRRADSR